MIPQYLHWVWPCSAQMQPQDKAALCSWRDSHPAWRHLLWTSAPENVTEPLRQHDFEIRPLPLLVNHRLYSLLGCHSDRVETENFPHQARAIVASIEIMARYGGVCPVIGECCACNIESLLRGVHLFTRDREGSDGTGHTASLGAGKAWRTSSGVALPLYGATPNHPALWNVVRDLRNSVTGTRECPAALSAAALVELLQFRLGRHPDLVTFPVAAFEEGLCSTL